MKKQTILTILALAMLAVLFAFPVNAAEWTARWKFGTIAPDGVGWAKQIRNIVVPAVEQATEGNLEVKVYWGGVMGDDEDYIKKMRIGQLQGAGWSGQGVTLAVPEMAVLELPFLFNDYGEVDYVKSAMTDTFDEIARKNGYMVAASIDEDFCRIYSSRYDMTTLQQYKEAKILSWFGPVEELTLRSLSASPIAVNMPEAPPALRQGVGDSIIASAIWILGTQLYSTVQHTSSYYLRYAPAMIAVYGDTWETMPEPYKKNYFAARPDVVKRFVAEVRNDNEKSLKAMMEYGLKETPIAETELKLIRENAKKTWEQGAEEGLYTPELLEEVLARLDECRNGKK